MFDGSRELSGEDRRLLELLDPAKTVAVVNKSDLPQKLELNEISAKLGAPAVISAKSGENSGEPAKLLEKAVSEKLNLAGSTRTQDSSQTSASATALSAPTVR